MVTMRGESWKEISKAGLRSGCFFMTIVGRIALFPVPIAKAGVPPVVALCLGLCITHWGRIHVSVQCAQMPM